MTKTITAKDLRNHFSQMLNLVTYGGDEIVVTRFNKPEVVLIDYEKFRKRQGVKKINTTKRTGSEILDGLSKLGITGGPKDLSGRLDDYLYD